LLLLSFFFGAGIEPRALCVWGKCAATELHPSPQYGYLSVLIQSWFLRQLFDQGICQSHRSEFHMAKYKHTMNNLN
jgi:hypothetical protein